MSLKEQSFTKLRVSMGLFFLISSFQNLAVDWIWNADLWYWRRPLCQLRHDHCSQILKLTNQWVHFVPYLLLLKCSIHLQKCWFQRYQTFNHFVPSRMVSACHEVDEPRAVFRIPDSFLRRIIPIPTCPTPGSRTWSCSSASSSTTTWHSRLKMVNILQVSIWRSSIWC